MSSPRARRQLGFGDELVVKPERHAHRDLHLPDETQVGVSVVAVVRQDQKLSRSAFRVARFFFF